MVSDDGNAFKWKSPVGSRTSRTDAQRMEKGQIKMNYSIALGSVLIYIEGKIN